MSVGSFNNNGKNNQKKKMETEKAAKNHDDNNVPKDSLNTRSDRITKQESHFFKLALYIVISVFAIMFFAFSITFFLTIRGSEKAMVPDLIGMELVDGLIDLQEKGLFPKVQERYSSDPSSKGHILKQSPPAGSLVKAGRRISITVSKGAIIDKVGDYVGKDLNDLKVDLQIQFQNQEKNLLIKEPIIYEYNSSPAGTILDQNPKPGTPISGLVEVELVVSHGEAGEQIVVGNYTDKMYMDIIKRMSRSNTPFFFIVDEESDANGKVVKQEPAAGSTASINSTIELTIAPPEKVESGFVFGLYNYSIAEFPIYVDLKFESLSSSEERKTIFETKHKGGKISIPYNVEAGSYLILSILDKEVHKYKVVAPE